MKWAHLPEQGGLLDQSPDLLDAFRYIFSKRAEREEEERKKQEAESRRNQRGVKSPSRPRR